MRAEVVVVGGGVMGTSIALELARRLDPIEQPVVLLEKATNLAAGSSGRSGAILRQHYADPVVARMAKLSLAEYASFEQRTGRSVGFVRSGVLTLAGPAAPEWIERVRANVEMLVGIGVDTRLVDAAEMRALVPGIVVDDAAIGAWEPGGGFVDPVTTVEAFAGLARTAGATTRLATRATGLRLEGGRVRGVVTDQGDVEAERVVLVAGPWSSELLRSVGVDLPLRVIRPEQYFADMPPVRGAIRPERGDDPTVGAAERVAMEAGLEAPAESTLDPLARIESANVSDLPVAHPIVIDLEGGYYTRCEPPQERSRVGRIDYAHDDEVSDPDDLDEEVSAEFTAWAREHLERRLPVYEKQPDQGAQAAWYTLTPDARPVLGPLAGTEGLFVATGFSGHGFKLAPIIGLGMAQHVLGQPVTAFDADAFAPDRFGREGESAPGGAFGL